MKIFLKNNSFLIVILLIAALFRFWQISTLPGGLFPDEAANGLDVNSILNGDLQPFYERGNGREALFFYLLAIPVSLFGRGPWQHHIVSATLGFLEVLAAYFLARRLFGKRVALLSGFFMAVSSFATTVSRTAFRANLIPLFTTLTLLFIVKLFQTKDKKSKLLSALAAGVSFGLGFYTYISYRMMVPLLLGFGILLLLAFRDELKTMLKKYFSSFNMFVLGFLASFGWLGIYFLTHPGSFIGRAGQVSIFSKDLNNGDVLGTFLAVLQKTILGFFTAGDLNWRHNVSGAPFLSPFLSPFFAVSLIIFTLSFFVLLYRIWKKTTTPDLWHKTLVAGWFWFMLVPEITTAEGIPHGLRLIGVIPAIFILSAWGVDWLWRRLKKLIQPRGITISLAIFFLLSIFVYNFYLYFGLTASSPEYYYAFRSDLTEVSDYLNRHGQKTSTFLSLDKFSVQTVDYLTTAKGRPFALLDPERTYLVELKPGDQVIFTQSTMFDRIKFLEYHPEVRLVKQELNKFGQPIMLVYEKL